MEEDLAEHFLRRLVRFPSSHNTSPLTLYPQLHLTEFLSGRRMRVPEMMRTNAKMIQQIVDRKFLIGISTDAADVYYRVLSASIDSSLTTPNRREKTILSTCLRSASIITNKEVNAVFAAHPAFIELRNKGHFSSVMCDSLESELGGPFAVMYRMTGVKHEVQRAHLNPADVMYGPFNLRFLTVYFTRSMVLVVSPVTRKHLVIMSFDQWVMLCDTVSCRFLTMMVVRVNEMNGFDNLPAWGTIASVYQWGDKILETSGMNAYAVIGEFESIVTGALISFEGTDYLGLSTQFLRNLDETAAEISSDYGLGDHWIKELLKILSGVNSVNQLSELFGMRKHWGNPLVDARLSGHAAQVHAGEEIPIYGSAVFKLLASFNRMITVEFIKKHGEWPECVFAPHKGDYPLRRAWAKGITRLPEMSPGHEHLHWALQKFRCNCILEDFEDQLSIIGDKSVSVYRQNLDQIYIYPKGEYSRRPEHKESRRLIIEFLRTKHLSILEIFKIVMSGTIPMDWLANSAAMKGTEMKHQKARIFAVLTFELRQYFVATEELIKQHIFMYNPHQTMTLRESDLLAKLRGVTMQMNPSRSTRVLSVMHIIDFSKWNLRMKYENTCLVFKSIDDFLGTPGLVEQSHQIFSNMVNIVQDPFNPPANGVSRTESETVWRNHLAGWEGQRQKGWTALTSALLSDVERLTGVRSQICGQGDNQTLLSNFAVPGRYKTAHEWITSDPQSARDVIDSFYTVLERECREVGLKVKTAESCRSLSYFNYGKRLYFDGVELSMTIKRMCKAVTEPNETYPTSESLLKTMEGSTFAAGLYSHPSLLPVFCSRFATALQICQSYQINPLCGDAGVSGMEAKSIRLNARFVSTLMSIPSSLGGPPQQPFSAFLFRGHPDPLCSEFVMMNLLAKAGCQTSLKLILISQSQRWYNQDKYDRSVLIGSPFCLNLSTSPSAKSPLDKEILPAVSTVCRNPDVVSMFALSTDAYEDFLLQALSSVKPFQPLVINDLYMRSIPGRRKSFLAGLKNTTSLGRIVYEDASMPIIAKVAALELRQLQMWQRMYEELSSFCLEERIDLTQLKPHEQYAQNAREISWGTELIGVTVPHPLEQFVLVKADQDCCDNHLESCLQEHILFIRHSEELFGPPGSDGLDVRCIRSATGNPYLGSLISEGIVQRYVDCINPNMAFRDAVRLNLIRQWVCEQGSRLDQVICELICSRTNLSLEILNLIAGRPSRLSYSHRAALTAAINACSVSSTTNMMTRLYVSSNRMGDFSHGEMNYHLAYGPAFLCFQSLICLDSTLRSDDWCSTQRTIFHAHVRHDKVPVVYDGNLEVTMMRRRAPRIASVPILYASREKLTLRSVDSHLINSIFTPPRELNKSDYRMAYACQLIGESFVSEILGRELSLTRKRLTAFTSNSPISIGELSLITVAQFSKAISLNIYLMAPYSLHQCDNIGAFSTIAHRFLSTFSRMFWERFLHPFSSLAHLKKLSELSSGCAAYNSTRQVEGILSQFQTLLVSEMWALEQSVFRSILLGSGQSPYCLFAPNIETLRLFFSKHVEICVLKLEFTRTATATGRMIDYARDFSANIHSLSGKVFTDVILTVVEDFAILSSHLRCCNPAVFPMTKFVGLAYPWIDEIRETILDEVSSIPELEIVEDEFETLVVLPKVGHYLDIELPEDMQTHPFRGCDCPPPVFMQELHTECFFQPTGLISKSHYKLLEMLYKNQLPIGNCVCLGSSTGTDALALAMHPSCLKVFVNCYHPLRSFDSHSAGSYIPPAFIDSPVEYKLHRSSSSVVMTNDLLSDEAVSNIISLCDGEKWVGITCDVELPVTAGADDQLILMHNLVTIASCINGVCWMVVKIVPSCLHDLHTIITKVGSVFSVVTVDRSLFSRPGTLLLYLVCSRPRVRPIKYDRLDTRVANKLALLQELDVWWEGLTAQSGPLILSLSKQNQSLFMRTCSILPRSFTVACMMYIKGWGYWHDQVPSKQMVISDLTESRRSLIRYALELTQMSNRAYREVTMVRSSLLQVEQAPLHTSLESLYYDVFKADLLIDILSRPPLSMESLTTFIWSKISGVFNYPMKTRQFRLSVPTSHFVNHSSRYLFEILGCLNNFDLPAKSPQETRLNIIHYRPGYPLRLVTDLMYYYQPCTTQFAANKMWKWDKRSEALLFLLSIWILPERLTYIQLPHPYIPSDLIRISSILDGRVTTTDSVDSSELAVIWVNAEESYNDLAYWRHDSRICCMSLPVGLISIAADVFDEISVVRLPWSGFIPDRAFVICKSGVSQRKDWLDKTPNLGVAANVHHDDFGFLCCCHDCYVEYQLCMSLKIPQGRISSVISVGKFESQFMSIH